MAGGTVQRGHSLILWRVRTPPLGPVGVSGAPNSTVAHVSSAHAPSARWYIVSQKSDGPEAAKGVDGMAEHHRARRTGRPTKARLYYKAPGTGQARSPRGFGLGRSGGSLWRVSVGGGIKSRGRAVGIDDDVRTRLNVEGGHRGETCGGGV